MEKRPRGRHRGTKNKGTKNVGRPRKDRRPPGQANEQAQPLPPMGSRMNLGECRAEWEDSSFRAFCMNFELTRHVALDAPRIRSATVLDEATDLPPTTGSAVSSQPSHALVQSKLPFVRRPSLHRRNIVCPQKCVQPPNQPMLPQTWISAGQGPSTCDTVIVAGTQSATTSS